MDKLIVNVGSIIIRGPCGFSVGRGRTSAIILLFSRVYYRNPIVEHGKGDGILVQPRI